MRYRGPLEYDKFVLNILQFHNEVNSISLNELSASEEGDLTLIDIQDQINRIYDQIVGKYNPDPTLNIQGISERLYYRMLDYKEC
jgi:hypothetical protein